jgi:hypothetical protein
MATAHSEIINAIVTGIGADDHATGQAAEILMHLHRAGFRIVPAGMIEAAKEVLSANEDFRAGMSPEWDGDPLTDACDKLQAEIEGLRVSTELTNAQIRAAQKRLSDLGSEVPFAAVWAALEAAAKEGAA